MANRTISPDAKRVAKILGTLRHPLRLLMVCELADGPRFAGDFTERLGTTKGNISQHLTLLLKQGLIGRSRQGTFHLYRLKDARVAKLTRFLFREFCGRPELPVSLKPKGVRP